MVSVACALVGVAVMVVGSVTVDGAARIFVLGLGHSVAYAVGVVVLGVCLTRRTGGSLWPAALGRIVAVSAVVGAGGVVGRRTSSSTPTRAGWPTWRWSPASGSSGPG